VAANRLHGGLDELGAAIRGFFDEFTPETSARGMQCQHRQIEQRGKERPMATVQESQTQLSSGGWRTEISRYQ